MAKDLAVNIVKSYLDSSLDRYNESGGINKDTLLAIGFICFAKILLIDIIFGRSGQLICHFIGFAYPAYRTTKVIESNRNCDNDTDKIQWLMYWVVFASFHLVEFFSDTILGWMPMYWICKSMFLLACMSPLNLCSVLYHMIILPMFKKSETIIDNVAADCRAYALNQCQKSLSLDTAYGRLQLEAISDSLITFNDTKDNKTAIDINNKRLDTNEPSRFEELEIPSSSSLSNLLSKSTAISHDDLKSQIMYSSHLSKQSDMTSDSIIVRLPFTSIKENSSDLVTSNKVSEISAEKIRPQQRQETSFHDVGPRPSPKKKKAPLPPNKKLRIDEEAAIERYLNDNF